MDPHLHPHLHPHHTHHQSLMDPTQHYNPYAHPYAHYRVGPGVKDHHHHHQTVESAAQAAAVQTRILEMRKEKSRDAARSRRGKENHEFYELAKMLPLPAAITSQLDKASIIRLTISYLKLREFSSNGHPDWSLNVTGGSHKSATKLCKQSNIFDLHQGTHILQSLDGFAFTLGQDGRFLYISETVSIYLGLSQVEMTGSSFFDYVHQQDHAELMELFGIHPNSTHHSAGSSAGHLSASSPLPPASVGSVASSDSESGHYSTAPGSLMSYSGPGDNLERQFCVRMKSTLTKRGCQHFKSSGYRVVHVVSHLRPEVHSSHHQNQRRDHHSGSSSSPPKIMGLVGVAIALPPPSVNELRLEPDMFVVRLGLDFKILHVEPRVTDLLDYAPDELIGRSLYTLVYGQDIMQVRKFHNDLMHKGQVMSKYYRVMNKNGGYSWIQTCSTLINTNTSTPTNGKSTPSSQASNSATSSATTAPTTSASSPPVEEQEQCIISINYVISGHEMDDVILDAGQIPGGASLYDVHPTPCLVNSSSHQGTTGQGKRAPKVQRSSPSPASTPTPNNAGARNQDKSNNGSTSPNGDPKRRRFTSSPVRPWKSPSPQPMSSEPHHHHSLQHHSMGSPSGGNSAASSLLRHISVIRETPPVLKPQVVSPSYHHQIPAHHHVPTHHHYHHLVDPYAAAYHLYKNGAPVASNPMTGGAPTITGSSPAAAAAAAVTAGHHPHHWGAYN